MDLSQIINREIWSLSENVQQMEKNFVKTGLFDENDKNRVLEITHGDNYTYIISKMYAWLFQIGEYNRGGEYSDEKKESEWQQYNRNTLDELHQEFISYNQNVFPIENFSINDGGTLHPIEIFGAFKGRRKALNVLKKIPNVYLRNIKDDIRKPRNDDVLYYTLPDIMGKINSHLKLVERLSDEKQNIIYKKVFSSKNDTLELVLKHLDNTNINYLYHEDAIDELRDKVVFEADTNEAELLYDDGNVIVVDVKSSDAVKNLGCGSQWCFSTEYATDHWGNYADNSHVNIIYNFNEDADSPLRMVVVLPQGSVYNMYNEYMDGEENMSGQEGWYYLDSIGAADHVNANAVPEEIEDGYDPKSFVEAEDKSIDGIAKKSNAEVIYDNNKKPFYVKELDGQKDYIGIFEDKNGRLRQIGGVSYHRTGNKIVPLGISLEDKYQNKGIATSLSNYIKEKMGNKLLQSIDEKFDKDSEFIKIAKKHFNLIRKNIKSIPFKLIKIKTIEGRDGYLTGFNFKEIGGVDLNVMFLPSSRKALAEFSRKNNCIIFNILDSHQRIDYYNKNRNIEDEERFAKLRFNSWVEESTFVHEFVHYLNSLEYGDTYKTYTEKNMKNFGMSDYYNSPEEYNAFYIEGVNDILTDISKRGNYSQYKKHDDFTKFIKQIYTLSQKDDIPFKWNYLNGLEGRNKRGFIKRMYELFNKKIKSLDEGNYMTGMYSDDELEHINDPNDRSDGGLSGFALQPPTVSDANGEGDLEEMNLPIGKIFTAGGEINEVESYLDISPSLLRKAVKFIDNWRDSKNNDRKSTETLRKIYLINAQNINKALDITSNGVKYYNNLLHLQNGLKKLGLLKEDLEYAHIAGDATKDKYMIGEDGSSLYSGEQGTVDAQDQAPWIQEEVIPYSDDDMDYDDEYDMDDIYAQIMNIVEKSGINILSSKNLSGFVMKNGVVGGAIFTEITNDEYSFDVVVDEKYRGTGFGKELIQYGIDDYNFNKDAYGDNLKLNLDVVNPIMRDLLKKHFNFKDVEKTGVDRYYMGMNEEESIVPYNQLNDIVKELNSECFAIISAFVTERSNNYNSKATKILHDKILKPLNTKIIKMTGQWDVNVLETAFFITKPDSMECDKFKEFIIKTAKLFKQESYLWNDNGDILINYTDGTVDDIGDDLNVTNSYVGFKFEGDEQDADLLEMNLIEKEEPRIMNEESISRLLKHIQNGDFGIISANRNELTAKENDDQSKKLSSEIQANKAGHINLEGHWEELHQQTGQKIPVREKSFFIPKPKDVEPAMFKNWLLQLGKDFNQESVIIGIDGQVSEFFMNGGRKKLGNNLSMDRINRAYSSMRKKPNVRFVFESMNESRRVFPPESYEDVSNEEIIEYKKLIDDFQRKIVRKEYFSAEEIDDVLHIYLSIKNNFKKYAELWGRGALDIRAAMIISLLKQSGIINESKRLFGDETYKEVEEAELKEDRIKSWMPKMTTPSIKKSCRLGGKKDGTSDACSQGDTGVVSYKPLVDGQSHKPNEPNVADDKKWFDLNNVKEGVGDKFLQNKGIIADKEQEFNQQYNVKNSEEIVGDITKKINEPNYIVKNPKNLKSFDCEVRGVIDVNGNLYVHNKHWWDYTTHTDLLDELDTQGIIKNEKEWYMSPPNTFLTVQRDNCTNIFLVGESNAPYGKSAEYWNPDAKDDEAYHQFLDRAALKNPNINFPHKKIYENVTNENKNTYIDSMINEGNIPTLEGLPFKDKIESMGGEIYSVGGAVRDEYLGKPSKDLDIVVRGIPEKDLLSLVQKYGRAEIDGKSFGVIKFKEKGADPTEEPIDIALPRTEKSTGAGHKNFEVSVDHNLNIEDDLKRRDFTINAIAKDSDGAIIDPFNGRQDLKDKVLRMTSPQSFIDDELRMLRGVQFASRFDFEIEPKTLRAMRKAAPTIVNVAKERWLLELDKIVEKGDPWTGLEWLKKTNLYEHMFGKDVGHNRADFANINTLGEFIFMMIKDSEPKPVDFVLNNLMGGASKEGKSTKAKLGKEVGALNLGFKNVSDIAPRNRVVASKMMSSRYWPEIVNSEVLPEPINVAIDELKSGRYPLSVKELDVDGHDLMQLGLKNAEIGKANDILMFGVYYDRVRNEKDELLKYLQTNPPTPEPMQLKESVEKQQIFGCLMVFPEMKGWTNVVSKIHDDDLYMPNDPSKGKEDEPHITILYGFDDKVQAEDFIPFLSGISEPIDIQIKGISHFESEGYDVVKLDCESLKLREIRKYIEQLPHTKTYPRFEPHMTLAYVLPKRGAKYDYKFKQPILIKGTKIVYSNPDKIKSEMEVAQPIEPEQELL